MFHLPVVLEKSDIIAGRLDPQDEGKLVIHLDRRRSHVVLDPRSFDPGVKVVADLPLVIVREFSAQEGGDVLTLDCVDGGPDERLVDWLQFGLSAEDQIVAYSICIKLQWIPDGNCLMTGQ